MLAALAFAASVQLTYDFPVGQLRTYDVKVAFEGFIPLLGGQEGKVEVGLLVDAKGVKPDDKGEAQVWSELKDIKIVFNGAPLNFVTLKSAQEYFPPTTISVSPTGETLRTNAPDTTLPVKLPGLDIKRFPDITYLPLQLPADGAEVGKSYAFEKMFGDSPVKYIVTPSKITDDTVELILELNQSYAVLENESIEVVKDDKEAVSRVATVLKGKGTATFDRKLRVFRQVDVSAVASSIVTDLESKKTSERKLKTSLTIRLK